MVQYSNSRILTFSDEHPHLGQKVVRVQTVDGGMYLFKTVVEFFVGRYFFIIVALDDKGKVCTRSYQLDDIVSVEYKSKGEFVQVSLKQKRG